MLPRPLLAFAATMVGAVAALAGCGQSSWEERCTTSPAGVIECAPGDRPPPVVLSGELLHGGSYDITGDRGKVVVLNFWGSWCAPCRAEADDLEQTYQATKDQGVAFVGVNHRDTRDAAKAFERGRVTFPSLFDPASRVALNFDVTPNFTPSTIVLDRQGRIAAAKRGATTVAELRPLVQRLAAEPANAGA